MTAIKIISGFILGIVATVLTLQFIESNIHPVAYWRANNSNMYWTAEECIQFELECNREVGWLLK